MTDTVTILAQKRNRPHSHRLYMESITINREDELFIWVLKANLACIVYYQSQAVMAAEADDLRVISKEALGNSWGILSAILGHKYHQNHPEKNLQPKTEFDYVCLSVCVCAILVEWNVGIYFFLSCTTLVIIDFSYFKQCEKKININFHR